MALEVGIVPVAESIGQALVVDPEHRILARPVEARFPPLPEGIPTALGLLFGTALDPIRRIPGRLSDGFWEEVRRLVFEMYVPGLDVLGPARNADVVVHYVSVGGRVQAESRVTSAEFHPWCQIAE